MPPAIRKSSVTPPLLRTSQNGGRATLGSRGGAGGIPGFGSKSRVSGSGGVQNGPTQRNTFGGRT